MTPEQRSKNRRAGLILAVVVLFLFLWTIGKGLKIV
ncbi:cytochrome oxidase small assembly protein [Advenella faeciporci]|nr:cytochrome oxidase small assembly protein [Advenella faeciporci]